MDLREYLFRNEMTMSAMAQDLGVNAAYLRAVKRKESYPSKKLALRIEIITGGQVTYEELRYKDKDV